MSSSEPEKRRKRRGWTRTLWQLLLLIKMKGRSIPEPYRSLTEDETEEEIERKKRRERAKSDSEREYEMAQ